MANLIGQRMGQYLIVDVLGKGGMATVYRARQSTMDRDVAIKIIKADLAEREEFLKRFQREARVIASLSHPHILKVFEIGQYEDTVFLVMELLTGGSLHDLLSRGALSLESCLMLTSQIASAMDYAHQHGIVHRDMKPQNVLLDENGNAFLSDFGLARVIEDVTTLTQSGSAVGTPAYMSPEQWRGESVDWRTDIYAFGVILFQMLVGQLPFDGDSLYAMMHKHLNQAPPSLRRLNRSIPLSMDGIIEKTLAKNREARFASATAVVDAFRASIQGLSGEPGPTGQTKLAKRQPVQAPGVQKSKATGSIEEGATFVVDESQTRTPSLTQTPKTGQSAGPRLYAIFEYLAELIAERDATEPFLFNQIEPTIRYMAPDFDFALNKLSGPNDLVLAGEKAGYFKLVDTGDSETSYLVPGLKFSQNPVLNANTPPDQTWMAATLEKMVNSDRADQIVEAMKDGNALSPVFDQYLAVEGKSAPLYPVRGKIQRLRDFLKMCREQGIIQAQASWQTSRTVRMPTIPKLQNAAVIQTLIWAVLQGNKPLEQVPVESLDSLFFAVIAFSREQMARNKAWDWAAGLDILEADARAMRRSTAAPKRGLFSGGKAPALDENEIKSLTTKLRRTAGVRTTLVDDVPIWQAFVETPSLDASLRYLSERQDLIQNEALVNWLDAQISQAVADQKMELIKNLATKSAILIAARQFGAEQLRQQVPEMKRIYESVLQGAQLLSMLYRFIDAPTPEEAAAFLVEHDQLADNELVEQLLDQQTMNAVFTGHLGRYRILTERSDLWRNLIEFGPEEGLRQHELFLSAERDDGTIQAEMGIMLLAQTKEPDECYDIIGRFPRVASKEALSIVTHRLNVLSRRGSSEEYDRYLEVRRLIELCLQVGVDRALAQVK